MNIVSNIRKDFFAFLRYCPADYLLDYVIRMHHLKALKNPVLAFSVLLLLCSCELSDDNKINIAFSNHILADRQVSEIAFDDLGNAWIGTFNATAPGILNKPELIKYNIISKETVVFNSSNSPLTDTSYIWDIAVDKENNIWVGSDCLIKFNGTSFITYNTKNSSIPVPYIHSIKADSRNNIWFSSSSPHEGGLVKFDGTNWTVFTPENSDLPMHGVADIAIDKNDNIWLAQYRYLGQTNLVRISADGWTVYASEELGCSPVYWGNITLDDEDKLYGVIDYTLDYGVYDTRPQILAFDGVNCTQLVYDNTTNIFRITIDDRNNIWSIFRCPSDPFNNSIAVFDGEKWYTDSLSFRDTYIETIQLSKDYKIWLGTGEGVYF